MKVGLTTEADLRRLYEELEACRLEEVRSGRHCTQFYALDRFAAIVSFILRSVSHLAATVSEFGWFSSAGRLSATRSGRFPINSEPQDGPPPVGRGA